MLSSINLKCVFAVLLLINVCSCQISFQEEDGNLNRAPVSHDRKPVVSPVCGENELLYPGDNVGDWVCDCDSGFLYYPKTSKCYKPFKQGPCAQREIIVLPPSKPVPVCITNPCPTPNQVQYNKKCYPLLSPAACGNIRPPKFLQISDTTMQLHCEVRNPVRLETDCNWGSKRAQEEKCTPEGPTEEVTVNPTA